MEDFTATNNEWGEAGGKEGKGNFLRIPYTGKEKERTLGRLREYKNWRLVGLMIAGTSSNKKKVTSGAATIHSSIHSPKFGIGPMTGLFLRRNRERQSVSTVLEIVNHQ
jgi:hypothetical protein